MLYTKLVGVLVLLLMLLGITWYARPRPTPLRVPVTAAFPAAVEFKLTDLAGKQLDSARLKGHVVVLDLWATWCAPCIEDITMFNRLQEKYGPRGLTVVAAAMQSGWPQDIQPVVDKHRMKYTIVIGDEILAEQYPYIGLPTTFLIDKDWRIAKKFVGTIPDREGEKEGELEREIQKLLQAS